MLTRLMAVSLLCLLSGKGWAGDSCVQDWACVEVEKSSDGGFKFFLSNKRPFTIAMTLNVEPTNLVSKSGDSISMTVPGNKRLLALSYHRSNRHKATHYYYRYRWVVGSLEARHEDGYLYRLPYAAKASPKLIQGFNGSYSHQGRSRYALDFAMPEGSLVLAAREGIVVDVESHNNRGGPDRQYADQANFVTIMHCDGTTGEYYHLQQNGVLVKPGDRVKRGQPIGLSGNTGFSSLPHLHFAVYKAKPNGQSQSLPIRFIGRRGIVSEPKSGVRYRVAKND